MVLTRSVDPKSRPNIGESSKRKAQKRKSMKGCKVLMPESSSGTSSKSRIHGRKVGINYPRILNWNLDKLPSGAKLEEDVFSAPDVQDINPSEMETVQPYMDGVLYNKPQQPSLSCYSRSSKINRTAKKSKPRILMITDGRLSHSSDIDDDDDFVDPPLRRQRTSFSIHYSMDPLMELDKMYVESSKE
ncbi:Hypothetical predicted protein [Olea europaea subsp. europaea]|uniref:Uncharacterized protein n=1 Tax=Olea europaea subsp. europaea TaxID=158383 RepID=A0A8S0V4C1_OLEEU|nr:Hypothetical predicted protein [Olea europaea subsp. europaea]